MSKFTEAKLEEAIIELLEKEEWTHVCGDSIARSTNAKVSPFSPPPGK